MKAAGWNGVGYTTTSGISFEQSLLLANASQVPLSFLYISSNAIMTAWISNREWLHYSTSHRPLKVTRPVGRQQSAYVLGLPWYISAILMAFSSMIHWLGSQAFFATYVTEFTVDGYQWDTTFAGLTGIAVSNEASIVLLAFGSLLVLTLIGAGFFRYDKTSMPLGANSSATISAACHSHYLDDDAATKLVPLGEVDVESERDSNGMQQVRHLTFTSLRTKEPSIGALYAGNGAGASTSADVQKLHGFAERV
jgi:hypothetical protein